MIVRIAEITAWLAACCWLGCGGRSALSDLAREDAVGGSGGEGVVASAGGGGGCIATSELCNGADDDCDGEVDEDDPELGIACDTGLSGLCAMGAKACDAGTLLCTAVAASDEICNGIDDDCDGTPDDGDPGGGAACDTGGIGVCGAGTVHCLNAAVSCVADTGPTAEVCDDLDNDCNGVVDDPPICTRRVFVTSQVFVGDLGGLAGADMKCQALADAVDLGGVYKAWLSSSTVSAKDRLTHVGKPYVLVDGTVVADDWAEFASEFHAVPIDLSEIFGPPPLPEPLGFFPAAVFTATESDGTATAPGGLWATCDDWESSDLSGSATVGNPFEAEWAWSAHGSGGLCDNGGALYCLEQ